MFVLVDTGPLVAYLDRGDPAHNFVRTKWGVMSGRFVTTGAVVTEAIHFLSPLQNGPQKLLEFLRDGTVLLQNTFRMALLDRAGALMEQYADVPMDFADATLVVLAEEVQTARIVTLDERGFRAFRYGRNKPFRLLLQDT
jgi:predicted nucleic acid-binding protein